MTSVATGSDSWQRQHAAIRFTEKMARQVAEDSALLAAILHAIEEGKMHREIAALLGTRIDPQGECTDAQITRIVGRISVEHVDATERHALAAAHWTNSVLGTHTITAAERARGLQMQGSHIWTRQECARLFALLEDPEHQHTTGRWKGRPDFTKVAATMNAEFGVNFTPAHYRSQVYSTHKIIRQRCAACVAPTSDARTHSPTSSHRVA